ncbi:hypothetical protein SK128_010752, partial [Halocaridina rubra]
MTNHLPIDIDHEMLLLNEEENDTIVSLSTHDSGEVSAITDMEDFVFLDPDKLPCCSAPSAASEEVPVVSLVQIHDEEPKTMWASSSMALPHECLHAHNSSSYAQEDGNGESVMPLLSAKAVVNRGADVPIGPGAPESHAFSNLVPVPASSHVLPNVIGPFAAATTSPSSPPSKAAVR